MKLVALLVLALTAALAPAQQSTFYSATRLPGEPSTLVLADFDPTASPSRGYWFDETAEPWHWRVQRSPYGVAGTRAVAVTVNYTVQVDSGGFENRTPMHFAMVSQQYGWTFKAHLPATRRAPRLTINTHATTYPYGVQNVAPFDGVLDFAGPSGRSNANLQCALSYTFLMTDTENPAAVARFASSHPGDPGYVHLDLGGGPSITYWAGDDVYNPAPPFDTYGPGVSHGWMIRCSARAMNVSIGVRHYNYTPPGL